MKMRVGKLLFVFAVGALLLAPICLAADAPAAKGPGAPNAEKLGWRLGCQAYSFNRFTFFEAVDKTASLGLKYIEAYPGQKLSPEHPDLKFEHDMTPETMAMVKAKLDSAGIKLVNYGVVGLGKEESEARKVFEFAKKMGIETIVSEPKPDEIPMLNKLTEEYGINIAIHNHPWPSQYWNYDHEFDVLQNAGKRIGSCSDTGHWARSGLVPLDGLKKLQGRIISLHFKDLNAAGVKGLKEKQEIHDVPWGTGVCDVKGMLTELKRQNFKGVFSIEYEYHWEDSVPDMVQCVAYFDKCAAELAK